MHQLARLTKGLLPIALLLASASCRSLDSQQALADLYAEEPGVEADVEAAAGYAVFSNFSLHPGAQVRTHLRTHVAQIFADVATKDAYQLKLDRQRVTDLHQLAFVVELYKEQTGGYPFVDPVDGTLVNVILGDETERDDAHYVDDELFVIELSRVLGDSLELALEPSGDNARYYVYSVSGNNYAVAAMLYHPVGWSEGILPQQWQYRVGSIEGTQIPVLEASKLFAGGYTGTRSAQSRDPSMQR